MILGAVKLVVLLVNPQAWYGTVGKLWTTPGVALVISIVLGALVLKYLLTELTIVQVFASMAFSSLFFWLALRPYGPELYNMVTRDTRGILKKNWLSLVIWIALAAWVLTEIF